MAKYRITSIPQSLPEAREGGSLKLKKVKKPKSGKLKDFVFGKDGERPNIAMDMFNMDMFNDPTQRTTANQPMVEVEGAPQPSYWNMQQGCPPGKFSYNGQCFTEAEYIEYSKREMEEYERSINQKKAASQQRFEGIVQENQQRAEEQNTRLNQEETERYYNKFKNSKKSDKIDPYMSIPNLNMDRMVDMVDSEGNPILGEDGKPQQESLGDQLKKSFLVNVTENGYTQLYPKDIVYDRIIKNGFQADQFKNIWGLDPKQVESQLGDVMKQADAQYTGEVTQQIINKALDEGKTTSQVISELSSKVGNKEALQKKFGKSTQKLVDNAYTSVKADILKNMPGVDQSKVNEDRDLFFGNKDPKQAWLEKYHGGKSSPFDFSPFSKEFQQYYNQAALRGDDAYAKYKEDNQTDDQNRLTTLSKDDRMADQRVINQMNTDMWHEKNANVARRNAENQDYDKFVQDYIANYSAEEIKKLMGDALNKTGASEKDKLKFLKDLEMFPDLAMQELMNKKTGYKQQTYGDLLANRIQDQFVAAATAEGNNTMKAADGVNENTTGSKVMDVLSHPFDAFYYWMNPREEMWGTSKKSYESRLDDSKRLGVDLGTMPLNPMSVLNMTSLQAFNPFKIGRNLVQGYQDDNLLNAVGDELIEMGTARGLKVGANNIGNGNGFFKPLLQGLNNPLMNAGFLAHVPKNTEDFIQNINQGNYKTAAWNALQGYWGLNPVRKTFSTLNNLRNPGTISVNSIPQTKFTGMYNAATPGSGIAIGNTNINTASPVFQSVTNPLNNLSNKLGFGQFSILKQNQGLNNSLNGNATLGFRTGGSIPKAKLGMIVSDLQSLGNPAKMKQGGALPQAQMGFGVPAVRTASAIGKLLKKPSQFSTTMEELGLLNNLDDLNVNLSSNAPILNTIRTTNLFQNKLPSFSATPDYEKLLRTLPDNLGGTSIISYGDEPFKGLSWYHVDPEDYGFSKTWRDQGRIDAEQSIGGYLGNLKPYGPDAFNNIGDFDFAIGSDGWKARNAMMGMASPLYQPQKTLGTGDFYTFDELSNLVKKQTQYLNDRAAFDEMYPEDPARMLFTALSGDNSRDQFFANLFPNSGVQNFKEKFYTPELLDLMKQTTPDDKGRTLYDQLVSNTNFGDNKMLNLKSLNSVTKGEDTLPSTYKSLMDFLKGDKYLFTAPANHVVSEFRGTIGLSMDDIENASPAQLEKWRQEIVKKMYNQAKERWDKDSTIPLTGYDAYQKFFSVPGSKNKLGGSVPKARTGLEVLGKNVNNIENILNGTAKSTNLLRLVDRAITPVGYGIVGKMLASPFTYIKPYVPQTYGLKNRYDAWNLYNQIQPKYGGLSLNEDGTVAVKNFDISKPILDQIRNSERNSFETAEFNNMNGYQTINFGGVHGNGLVAKGVDDTGRQYIDFTDTWDLHPLEKFGRLLPKSIRSLEVGQVTGGKPFDLRNRIYFDGEGNYFDQDGTPLVTYSKEIPGFDYRNGALQVQQNASSGNIQEIELPENVNTEFVASAGVPESEFHNAYNDFSEADYKSHLDKIYSVAAGAGLGAVGSFLHYQNNKPMLMIDVRTGKVVSVTKAEMEANPGRYISTKNLKRGGAISKKKTGGVVTELTKKEIEQYVKDGYIIEDY